MPSSGAFVCSDFVVLGVLRRKIVVSTKHCKLQESIRFPSFVRRLESRLRTPDSRPVMASEPQSPTCAPCYGEISACSAGARAAPNLCPTYCYQLDFHAGTGPETADLPVIREYQGESNAPQPAKKAASASTTARLCSSRPMVMRRWSGRP